MKSSTRELLLITKATEQWHDNFDQKVDEIMSMVAKIDTEDTMQKCAEVLDVYHSTLSQPATPTSRRQQRKKMVQTSKPFEFLVFRN